MPASAETIYRIGSITKQFTATMLLQLVRDKKVSLSDPVSRSFPEFATLAPETPGSPPITLLQLATHRSGLAREPTPIALYSSGAVSNWEKSLAAALSATKYINEPGERYLYSNVGYAALGVALSRAAEQPYVEYVQNRIIKPLALTQTFFEPDLVATPKIARGYVKIRDLLNWTLADRERRVGRGYRVPNGALFSTVTDLGKLLAFELGHGPKDILPFEVLKENEARASTMATSPGMGYGIGLMRMEIETHVIYGHNGQTAGYQSAAYFEPASQRGLIVLRNAIGKDFRIGVIMRAAFSLASAPRLETDPATPSPEND